MDSYPHSPFFYDLPLQGTSPHTLIDFFERIAEEHRIPLPSADYFGNDRALDLQDFQMLVEI